MAPGIFLYPGDAKPSIGRVIPNLIDVAVNPGSAERGLNACAGTVVTVSAATASNAEADMSF